MIPILIEIEPISDSLGNLRKVMVFGNMTLERFKISYTNRFLKNKEMEKLGYYFFIEHNKILRSFIHSETVGEAYQQYKNEEGVLKIKMLKMSTY